MFVEKEKKMNNWRVNIEKTKRECLCMGENKRIIGVGFDLKKKYKLKRYMYE